jgi:adapter protein MecA 1/2
MMIPSPYNYGRESCKVEIERINENTVKFYISYVDIEERGFDREEIWYNREKGEELFWEMLEEIHHEDDFVPEGPLWIQIQALDKGLEVTVTKAQLSKDGQNLELPIGNDKSKEIPFDERMEQYLDSQFQMKPYEDARDNDIYEYVLIFNDFEDVLAMSLRNDIPEISTKLYAYENKYFMHIRFSEDKYDEESIEDALSILLEYGDESGYTPHRLEEYAKKVIDDQVFETLKQYF